MKIGVLTFHRAENYGAVLQAFALNKVLNDFGVDAEEIDYYPKYFKDMYSLNPPMSLKHPRSIILKICRLFVLKSIITRNNGFQSFIQDNFRLSQRYSQNQLVKSKIEYDVLITGSDQVWNDQCANFDPIYFLDFPSANSAKKYSYAASFNFDTIPIDKEKEFQRRLKGYEEYSVREQSGIRIINSLLGRDAREDCDPTFLLSADDWKSLAKCPIEQYTKGKPYALVYYVNQSRELMEYARRIAIEKKIQVLCIPCLINYNVFRKKLYSEYDFTFLPSVSPTEFLSLINNASYILTNSFHGTVFSIIYEKLFFAVVASDTSGKNNRSKQLLQSLDLTSRILDSNATICSIDNPIEWDSIRNRINIKKRNSLLYLKGLCELDGNE